MATDEDTEFGLLVREALSRCASMFLSSKRRTRGYDCMLSNSSEQDAPSGATVVATVHAHGEGATVLEAVRDALGKLPKPGPSRLPSSKQEKTLGERTLADVTPRKAAGQ